MQTFLPYSDFATSAKALDNKRLGKQRVEAYQILRSLLGLSKGWLSHPAVKMWRGHEFALLIYGTVICREWRNRGFQDTVLEKLKALDEQGLIPEFSVPEWLGDEAFHRSHRANLIAKDPAFYLPQFGPHPFEPYVWPSQKS